MVDDREALSNAIALNSSMVNGARLIGPTLAGLVIAAAGEGWCFLIDGISYFAVIASLLLMRIRRTTMQPTKANVWVQMREGWDYVQSLTSLRTLLLLFALISLMGYPYMVLMPVFASQVLHGGPNTLGWLAGTSGVGALISALSLAVRKSVRGLSGMLPVAAGLLGGALIAFGCSHNLWWSLLSMLVAGFGFMQVTSATNTIIQSLVTEDKRARVTSYYVMAFFGAAPVGSLLAGALASHVGAPATVVLTGACCIAGAIWFSLRLPQVNAETRRIYEEKHSMGEQRVDAAVAV